MNILKTEQQILNALWFDSSGNTGVSSDHLLVSYAENGEIVIVSDTIINQSKEEDRKKRIESLLRAFNKDIPKKEPH